MAKGTVTESEEPEKQRRIAGELLREFENLPAEVRRSLAAHAATPDILEHVAGGIQRTLDDLGRRDGGRAQARSDTGARSRRARDACATRLASLRRAARRSGMGARCTRGSEPIRGSTVESVHDGPGWATHHVAVASAVVAGRD